MCMSRVLEMKSVEKDERRRRVDEKGSGVDEDMTKNTRPAHYTT